MRKIIKQDNLGRTEAVFQFTKDEYINILRAICYIAVDSQLFLEGEWEPDDKSMLATQEQAEIILETLGDFRPAASIYQIWRAANNAADGTDTEAAFLNPVLEDLGLECTTNQSSEQTTSSSEEEAQS